MSVANTSGVLLVTCDDKSCKNIIKESKSAIRGITSAYIVDKKTPDDPGVIINLETASKDDFMKAANTLLGMVGVQKVNCKIT